MESTDCTRCPFEKVCPMAEKHQRLPWDEGGLGLCPKLPEVEILRCRNCLFCHYVHPIYTCGAMNYNRIRPDGKIPATTPRNCPIKEAKRKGL